MGMTMTFVRWSSSGRKDAPGWVVQENGCHIWTGAVTGVGYGHVHHAGKMRSIHRLRYEQEVGPIPDGMELDHFVCDNRRCCNPAHVRSVTRWENGLRGNGVGARNRAKTHCPKGHPLSAGNLVPSYLARGRRECLECKRASLRAEAHRRREKHRVYMKKWRAKRRGAGA